MYLVRCLGLRHHVLAKAPERIPVKGPCVVRRFICCTLKKGYLEDERIKGRLNSKC